MSYHGPLPGSGGDDDISSTRVVGIVLAQFWFVASFLLRLIAIPLSLLFIVVFGIGLAVVRADQPGQLLLAQIMLGISVVLLGLTLMSFFYRSLRAPAAILTALIVVPGIVSALLRPHA